LVENIIEDGDQFIPQINDAKVKSGKYDSYSLLVNLKDKNGIHNEVWIKLTKAQAVVIAECEEPTQHLFKVNEYVNKFGTFLGIGWKDRKKPKTFEDFKMV
jgi:hypothetical protein